MIIGIDWNNTIQNQIGAIVKKSNGLLSLEDFAKWDDPAGATKMGMLEKEYVAWCWKDPQTQIEALPFFGVKEMLNYLKKKGYTIKIITHSFLSVSKIVAWFDQHDIPFDEIIKAADKADVTWDLLIDDNPIVINQMVKANRPILKFNLPWNSAINCPGFSDWSINSWEEKE